MKSRLVLFTAIIFGIFAVTAISFGQRKPDPNEKPITGDFKITIKNTMAGQTSQSTTMIKGQRERSESSMAGGMNVGQVNITQCDLKRSIKINEQARKYMITPFDSDASGNINGGTAAPVASSASQRGGVVTLTVNTTDTSERKEMFGFTARHLKRTTSFQSSPDACQQQQMRIDTDGWYINLEYGLNCGSDNMGQTAASGGSAGGCRDRYQYKRTGPTNLGYPLIETTTMYNADGSALFTRTAEVIELSRQPLDAALFDVPAGYTEVKTQQEMSGTPSMADMMAMSRQQSGKTSSGGHEGSTASAPAANANATAKARVGVVEFNNKTKSSVSTDSLRQQLIAMLNGDGIDAIALNASSPGEAAIEAKAKDCTYILYTDISTLKAASAGKKIGGLLGRATGVGSGDPGKSEARLDFRLIPTGSSSPTIQSSASAREDSEQASVSTAIEAEAKAVAAAVGKT
jgi:hypothetical protein